MKFVTKQARLRKSRTSFSPVRVDYWYFMLLLMTTNYKTVETREGNYHYYVKTDNKGGLRVCMGACVFQNRLSLWFVNITLTYWQIWCLKFGSFGMNVKEDSCLWTVFWVWPKHMANVISLRATFSNGSHFCFFLCCQMVKCKRINYYRTLIAYFNLPKCRLSSTWTWTFFSLQKMYPT